MPLASFVPPKRKIEFEGGDVQVRAVSLQDVSIILDSHQFTIDRIVTMLRSRGDLDFTNAQIITDTIMEAIRESPLLVANVIALCADEPEFQREASMLPLPVQIEVLQAIGDITFKDEAAVKKFVADVTKLIQGILPPMTETLAAAK